MGWGLSLGLHQHLSVVYSKTRVVLLGLKTLEVWWTM